MRQVQARKEQVIEQSLTSTETEDDQNVGVSSQETQRTPPDKALPIKTFIHKDLLE